MPEQIHVWEMPELEAFDGTHSAIAGRLIEFETKKYDLLPDHRRWLQDKVVPAILERPMRGWICMAMPASWGISEIIWRCPGRGSKRSRTFLANIWQGKEGISMGWSTSIAASAKRRRVTRRAIPIIRVIGGQRKLSSSVPNRPLSGRRSSLGIGQ